MEKKMKSWLLAMLTVVMAVSFTSCGDDDEKEEEVAVSALVGNWINDYGDMIYTLTADGIYVGYENIDLKAGTYTESWPGRWTYDDATKSLILQEIDDPSDYEAYQVLSVTSNTITLRCLNYNGEQDDSEMWRRVADKDMPMKYVPNWE